MYNALLSAIRIINIIIKYSIDKIICQNELVLRVQLFIMFLTEVAKTIFSQSYKSWKNVLILLII